MKLTQAGKLLFAITAFGISAVLLYRYYGAAPNRVVEAKYLCQNATCGAEFAVAPDEQSRLRAERKDVACPKCGQANTAGAMQCPSCGKFVLPEGHFRIPKSCPHCKTEMPRLQPPIE